MFDCLWLVRLTSPLPRVLSKTVEVFMSRGEFLSYQAHQDAALGRTRSSTGSEYPPWFFHFLAMHWACTNLPSRSRGFLPFHLVQFYSLIRYWSNLLSKQVNKPAMNGVPSLYHYGFPSLINAKSWSSKPFPQAKRPKAGSFGPREGQNEIGLSFSIHMNMGNRGRKKRRNNSASWLKAFSQDSDAPVEIEEKWKQVQIR